MKRTLKRELKVREIVKREAIETSVAAVHGVRRAEGGSGSSASRLLLLDASGALSVPAQVSISLCCWTPAGQGSLGATHRNL